MTARPSGPPSSASRGSQSRTSTGNAGRMRRGEVGRVGDHEIDGARRHGALERPEEIALAHPDAPVEPEAPHVLPGALGRLRSARSTAQTVQPGRRAARAHATAPEPVHRSSTVAPSGGPRASARSTSPSVSGRGMKTPGPSSEREPAELHLAQEVLDGLVARAARHERLEHRAPRGRDRRPAARVEPEPRRAERPGQEHLGILPGGGESCRGEAIPGGPEGGGDRRGRGRPGRGATGGVMRPMPAARSARPRAAPRPARRDRPRARRAAGGP